MPRERSYHARSPSGGSVAHWLRQQAAPCEACGRSGPQRRDDLFCPNRYGSRADHERRPLERLCAANADVRPAREAGEHLAHRGRSLPAERPDA